MIRAIHRWNDAPDRRDEFLDAWRSATRSIHAETPGALGGFRLEGVGEQSEFLTVALWRSEQRWRDFIAGAHIGPMAAIHEIGELPSTTPFNQLGDETAAL